MNVRTRQAGLLAFLGLFGVALVSAPAERAAAQQVPAAVAAWPDTIYVNGRIITLDDTKVNDNPGSIVQAMAVRDQKIMALGSNEEILTLKGPETRQVDLQGKTVVPGFVHGHNHVFGQAEERSYEIFGLRQAVPGYYLRTKVERTPEETRAKMKAAVDQLRERVDVAEDEWIGLNMEPDTDKGFPSIKTVSNLVATADPADASITQDDLDKISPDRMLFFGSGKSLEESVRKAKLDKWVKVSVASDGRAKLEEIMDFNWKP